MEYARKQYLEALINKMHNGRVKIITGLRRSGKSYLLFQLFVKYLLANKISEQQIISLSLDDFANAQYHNPFRLDGYIREKVSDPTKQYYILIDEIQLVSTVQNPYVPDKNAKLGFSDVLLGLMKLQNVDIYVTGSNSKMLSSDVLTQFRDRGDAICLYPLSYAEFYAAYNGDTRNAWPDYYTYGGLPFVQSLQGHVEKSRYLHDLLEFTYIRDVIERHNVQNESAILSDLLNIVASSVGSLTSPSKLERAFFSAKQIKLSSTTIQRYLDYFTEAFLLHKAFSYDVKGKKYMQTPLKYYYADIGLRNARLGFRQQEETHIMENVLFNDLLRRGYNVDVGLVEQNTSDAAGKKIRKQLEVDFVVNHGMQRYYIQSALSITDPEKRRQEIASLLHIPDSFRKIVVTRDYLPAWKDENGILYIGVEQFLLDEQAINF